MFCSAFALTLGLSVSSQCPNDPWEISYQTLHTIDYAQTVETARNPKCVEEDDNLTSRVIGHHPTVGKVEAWWAIEALVHYNIAGWLDRTADATGSKGWYAARWVWRVAGITDEARDVIHNHNIGLHPFGGDLCKSTGFRNHER